MMFDEFFNVGKKVTSKLQDHLNIVYAVLLGYFGMCVHKNLKPIKYILFV